MMLHFSMPRSVLTRSMRSSQPCRCDALEQLAKDLVLEPRFQLEHDRTLGLPCPEVDRAVSRTIQRRTASARSDQRPTLGQRPERPVPRGQRKASVNLPCLRGHGMGSMATRRNTTRRICLELRLTGEAVNPARRPRRSRSGGVVSLGRPQWQKTASRRSSRG